jgi:hypothetical protein
LVEQSKKHFFFHTEHWYLQLSFVLFAKSDNVAGATFKKRDSKKLVKKILATKILLWNMPGKKRKIIPLSKN